MTSESRHTEPPRSDGVRFPARFLLYRIRPMVRWIIRRWIRVTVHGDGLVPTTGPVIFASNHVSAADGPLLAIFAPRPVHTLTKSEMFRGMLGRFLLASGQIPLDRFHTDPTAVRLCLRVLRDGGSVGIFPEGTRDSGEFDRFHRGVAYFALISGAPVVPVIMLGTREPGSHIRSIPPRGARVDMVFGAPYSFEEQPWPRTREQVERSSMLLREHMLVHLDHARALTGRQLPGPLPANEVEPDPATGVTEQGAP